MIVLWYGRDPQPAELEALQRLWPGREIRRAQPGEVAGAAEMIDAGELSDVVIAGGNWELLAWLTAVGVRPLVPLDGGEFVRLTRCELTVVTRSVAARDER